jgi:farnesol dehydrogenase
MKIFVTGATGFMGANLVIELAESGHSIHALCRTRMKAQAIKHRNIRIFFGDILDRDKLDAGMKSCDWVFHLGALAAAWCRSDKKFFEVNVLGTKNVLDSALQQGVKKVVVVSTAGVFGPGDGAPVNEKTVRLENFLSPYDSSKLVMESMVQLYVRRGLNCVIVNPTRIYGPGHLSQANSVSRMVKMYLKGSWRIIPGSGRIIANYGFIDDIVKGCILAMDKGRPGERYLLGGENVDYNEFFAVLAEVSGKKRHMIHIPICVILGFARFSMVLARIFGIPPIITPGLVKKYSTDTPVLTAKAEQELGVAVTPLRTGLEKTVFWLSQSDTKNARK